MKVIHVDNLYGTKRDVVCPRGGFKSLRLLLREDNMGFSLTKTFVPKGEEQFWHYKNHLEACFCIKGIGVLTNKETGEQFGVIPGTMYALDKNDAHTLKALESMELVCVFNPPLSGREVHDEDGVYARV